MSGRAREDKPDDVVLVVDDDLDIARYVELNLSLEGFTVHVAHDGDEALSVAHAVRPAVVLLDVMMPGMDGYEVCRQLRSAVGTSQCAILMLTAKTLSADRVLGLTAGADDYIAKPFDPPELVARVRASLRRARQLRDVSPLTGLPGNGEITRRAEALAAAVVPCFALVHADLDSFKAYNDRYGFLRGDEAIRRAAEVMADAVAAVPSDISFLGHVGGDDFVLLTDPESVDLLCQEVIERFDLMAPLLYDAEDAERGWIEVKDRQRRHRRFGLMTISLGVASTAVRPMHSVAEASTVATEMKTAAKSVPGSAYRIDQRRT